MIDFLNIVSFLYSKLREPPFEYSEDPGEEVSLESSYLDHNAFL